MVSLQTMSLNEQSIHVLVDPLALIWEFEYLFIELSTINITIIISFFFKISRQDSQKDKF